MSESEKPQSASETPAENSPPPLRSVHTGSFPQILTQFHASLAVTTYQAGKLVLLRPETTGNTPVLNTHFRTFHKPMGFAWERGRFGLGTQAEVWEFHDIPAVGPKIDAPDSAMHHDACFMPRSAHVTGDVQIHEMVWVPKEKRGGDTSNFSELVFVNTRFSCLATRSNIYSFIPRWRPPFITALGPEDRCHLNGVALRDGKIRYVTALGETDTLNGWRENKRTGGIVMDVASEQVITRGLSMPHSPRWYAGKLWVLESGNGGLGVIDEQTGQYQEVCRLPGFTRGFDFAGPYAFVGLSQVRETAVFSGIAIAELPQEERCCGVWAVDIRNGKIVGFVKFMDAVQEIFAVQLLHNLSWPEVLSDDPKRIAETYELPNEALKMVPAALRSEARATRS
ncbi:MAG TPA: TIGR03032 family protein [Tepidisphaeraceae bacterium]|nr:TIGR03032 family protein [Tepidisphaeraceae bacterium]